MPKTVKKCYFCPFTREPCHLDCKLEGDDNMCVLSRVPFFLDCIDTRLAEIAETMRLARQESK